MALVSISAAAGGLIAVAGYWRVPYAFYKWKLQKPTAPAAGQVWAFARFSNKNDKGNWHTFTLTEVTETHVTFDSNWIEGEVDTCEETIEEWNERMKKLRGFILKHGDSLEARYWGDAAEE